jgi:hypothetical protein
MDGNVKLDRLKRIMAQTTVLTMTLGATLVATALPAQAQYVSVNATDSALQNIATSWTKLAIAGENPNYGEALKYSAWVGYNEWIIQDNAPNGHTIREYRIPGRCLDSNWAGNLYGHNCIASGYQRWHFNYTGKMWDSYYQQVWDTYEIRNAVTGLCLDSNATVGYTMGCNGGAYQRWFLIDINN